jgi:hypothetical protein
MHPGALRCSSWGIFSISFVVMPCRAGRLGAFGVKHLFPYRPLE